MKIRPKISKFQQGGVPQWYLNLYKQQALGGWNNKLRYNYADLNLNANGHYNAGNLETVYEKQRAYTETPEAVGLDILSFYNSDGKNMTAEEFVNFYNQNALKIRNHWASDLTYNASTAGDHNRLYRKMFLNRSNTSLSPGSTYNIGYQEGITKGGYDIQDIEGSSTWLRRMDRYENEFDINNPDSNRVHEITLGDGSKAKVYKKANGDIGLFPSSSTLGSVLEPSQTPKSSITGIHNDKYGFDWNKIGEGLKKLAPDILAGGRLAYTLASNERIFDEQVKGIRPDLRQSYDTYRLVVGDEAGKQLYYRRAAELQTKAGLPIGSDLDRNQAYMMEANRVGNELKSQGDIVDNTEIRRTSDESNQHQWANTLRRTEVANANIASINMANKLRHDLLALKHSANATSILNELLARETRLRQRAAERRAIEDLIYALDAENKLQNDTQYQSLYQRMSDAWDKAIKKHGDNAALAKLDPDFMAAQRDFKNAQYKIQRMQYLHMLDRAKSGMKITYKKKDDLLYKTARDAVEHFRKMTKMTSDANNRRRIKMEKLTSHPKGNAKKYLQGGVAPFLVYTPAVLGGETTTSTQTSSTNTGSSKSSKKEGSDTLDMVKELFKAALGKGLPSDMNSVYKSLNNFLARAEAFGTELSTDDIASMYLQQLQLLNTVEYMKNDFDKAKEQATNNDALDEFAVDRAGNVIIQNMDTGDITSMSWNDFKQKEDKNLNPLTNRQLLNIRATSPEYAFRNGLLDIVGNGVGITKISEWIKSNLPKIGATENTLEGYTKLESNLIIQGIEILKDAPSGDYKLSQYTKEQLLQAKAALNYIIGMMPRNMKAVLNIHADIQGTTPNELLTSLVQSDISTSYKLELDAVTGKAAKDKDGNSKEGLEINSAVQLLLGMSSPREFTFSIGNGNSFTGFARVSSINDTNETPFGADFSYSEIYKSSLRKNLDLDNASFGDVPINKALKDRIIVDNSTIAGVDLPYTTDSNGRIIPNFKMLNKIEEADLEVLKLGINPELEPQKVNEIYAKHGLPIKYGTNNRLTGNYKRFAVVQATAIEDVFLNKNGLASNGTLTLVSDENEIDKYLELLKNITGKKDIDMDRPGLFTGDKDIYKGSIFIPIIGDLTDAISGSKTGKLTENNYDDYRNKWNTRNYTEAPKFVKQ